MDPNAILQKSNLAAAVEDMRIASKKTFELGTDTKEGVTQVKRFSKAKAIADKILQMWVGSYDDVLMEKLDGIPDPRIHGGT